MLAKIESNQSLTVYELSAPIAGTIIDRQIALGEYASEQKPAFTVADLSTVWVDFAVYRRDLQTRAGRRHGAGRSEDGEPPIEAKISYISPVGNADTQSALARAVLPNQDRRLRPGLFVTARLHPVGETARRSRSRLSALQTMENRTVVFVRDGEKFEARDVELGDTRRRAGRGAVRRCRRRRLRRQEQLRRQGRDRQGRAPMSTEHSDASAADDRRHPRVLDPAALAGRAGGARHRARSAPGISRACRSMRCRTSPTSRCRSTRSAPGYSPLEVEQRITFPIETAMGGLPQLDYTRSLSRYGLSQVTVVFKDGTDIYFARQLVNERIQQVKDQLPAGIETAMGPIATGLGEIFMYAVEAKPGAKNAGRQPYTRRWICGRCRTGSSSRSCAPCRASSR